MDYISIFKKMLAVVVGYFLAIFDPISGMIYALLITMAVNCLLGVAADREQGNPYSFKKMFKCFKEYAFIVAGMFFSAMICNHMSSLENGLIAMKTICWAAILIYAKNMVRNAEIIYPDNHFLKFMNWIICFKFIKQNGYLSEYYEHIKTKDNEKDNIR